MQQFINKLKSRKFWMGLLGVLLPIGIQAATGQVGWKVAVGLSTAAAVTYILGQTHVDATTIKAIAALSEKEALVLVDRLQKGL